MTAATITTSALDALARRLAEASSEVDLLAKRAKLGLVSPSTAAVLVAEIRDTLPLFFAD